MNYNEFKTEFMKRLAEKAVQSDLIGTYQLLEDGMVSEDPRECAFIRDTNIKYNKMESDVLKGDFLRINPVDAEEGSEARLEFQYLYDSFEQDGWDFVWKILEENLRYAKNISFREIGDVIDQYEMVKDRLILRPLNYTDNKYVLKKFVYHQVGDMALVLYLVVADTKELGLNTTKVPREVMELWGKTEEEVFENALINTNVRSVPRMYNSPAESDHPKYQTGAYMSLGAKSRLATGMNSTVFTTYPSLNGAISFWYPGVKEKLAELAGGDFYVAFTGIHDFHIHPVNSTTPKEVLDRLKQMNRYMNGKDEILSRKVYRYQAESGELKPLDL